MAARTSIILAIDLRVLLVEAAHVVNGLERNILFAGGSIEIAIRRADVAGLEFAVVHLLVNSPAAYGVRQCESARTNARSGWSSPWFARHGLQAH